MMNSGERVVIGLGTIVSGVGRKLGGKIGAGILGFGLAHIFLGTLSKLKRPWR
ncbi:hypothetical protein [Natranaerobius trueperi]|uniref:hypothetical protein n=1 Tax=Natranaerobius trueperi TaxID=759412 RepID=UPI0013035359|nr:hypothetical protein [Natranaerobius trueperi]